MSRILIIGGYGGFGARLSRRLAAAGHQILAGGRDIHKAKAFCADLPGAEPLVCDRTNGIGLVMARHRPDLVVDAAGPFQGSDYTVPEACIAMRIPYLDLADGRTFVTGISGLDAAARDAGIPVIAGASSMSALSGAVTRRLAAGLDRVEAVDMAISASNRASAGASVAAAILSYVGQPVRLWRGQRWTVRHGWQELRRADFLLSDGTGLRGRRIAIADVADHEIVPAALPGRPAVTFRAGTELGVQMWALWLASWPVRWGWLRSLDRTGRWLLPLYRLMLGFGGDHSAMQVRLTGSAKRRPVERCWTLIASNGDGPEIPTLAAELLVEDMLAGQVAPGARHAWRELDLDRFEPLFAALSIRHELVERALPPPVYARVMGARFDALPPAVRALHEVHGDRLAAGEGKVVRGRNPIARLLSWVMRFPPAGDWPLSVAFSKHAGVETWTRDFGGHRFSSRLREAKGRVVERFGPIRFAFDLPSDAAGLEMRLNRWSVFGIRLPRWLAPRISAREWQEADRFRFSVDVAMPLIGQVVRYSGWLKPAE